MTTVVLMLICFGQHQKWVPGCPIVSGVLVEGNTKVCGGCRGGKEEGNCELHGKNLWEIVRLSWLPSLSAV
jgi:hypothetical protein